MTACIISGQRVIENAVIKEWKITCTSNKNLWRFDQVYKQCKATFLSRNSNYTTNATSLVLLKITGLLSTQTINKSNWRIPENLILADPTFCKPSKVDILLGQDYFLDILEDWRLNNQNIAFIQNTKLGWILRDRVGTYEHQMKHLAILPPRENSIRICRFFGKLKKIKKNCPNNYRKPDLRGSV